jgi:AcrR family transcriptional regulator
LATEQEIRSTARRILVRDGLPHVTLRAIATEMGMTAPALYRYVDGHEAVLEAMTIDCFDELVAQLLRARDAAPPDSARRLVAVSREFRAWALDHPAEFGLVFANPMGNPAQAPESPVRAAADRMGAVFAEQFVGVWLEHPFPVPTDQTIAAAVTPMQEVTAMSTLPEGALFVFAACWARLVGVVSSEVFGHLHWAVDRSDLVFEDMLAELATRLALPREVLVR